MQDGRRLAELRQYNTKLFPDYTAWREARELPAEPARLNFHRALVAWYEAGLQPDRAYKGEVLQYVTTVAGVYYADPTLETERFPLGDGPLDFLPETVQLDEAGRQMLQRLKRSGECQQLLLLSDYHRMESAVVARALDLEEELDELPERILDCREAVTQGNPELALRYDDVLRVAGRQDLMQTLERETEPREPEAETETVEEAPPPVIRPHSRSEDVKVSPRRRIRLPSTSPGMIVAAVLCGVLLWLAWDTWGGAAPDRLAAAHFEPYPNIYATEPPQTEADRDLERILYYYDRGDYRTAYDELLPAADAYPAAPLYLGVSALALDDPIRAREWFLRLNATSPYRDAADWYDALALLALDEREAGLAALRRIAGAAGHPYAAAAREVVRE